MAGLFETPQVPRLPSLLAEVRSGAILIPDFQRPLEWDDDRRLTLLDSVDKQMPIGAFLVWRTRTHALRCLDSLGAFKLPTTPGEQIPHAYLLDGHQRLATLFAALTWTDDPKPLRDQGMRWPIYYDLEPDPKDRAFRFFSRKGEPPVTWLPLYALLDPKRLFEHQKRLLGANKDAAAQVAEALAERFKDYQIPVVPLVSEDLSLVTESFVRVNSGGKAMSETYMVRALAYAGGCDIAGKIQSLRDELAADGWGGIEDQVLLNVLKARWGLHIYDTEPRTLNDRVKKDGCDQTFKELGHSVRWAIECLAEFSVRGPRALPYATQLVGIAELGRRLGQIPLDLEQRERLRRWFWATTYGEYFTGMPGNRIADAIDYLYTVIADGGDPIPPDLARQVAPIGVFNYRATRSRALMLLTTLSIDDDRIRVQTQRALGELGNETVQRLFTSAEATRPENRVAALPEEFSALRHELNPSASSCRPVLFDVEAASNDDLQKRHQRVLSRYLLPDHAPTTLRIFGKDEVFAVNNVLGGRRAIMDSREREFLATIGLELRDSDETTEAGS
ncbi:DUF262 domain-containing protein [uncultured Thiodictyon sp.]|uniref:DUF262 domain-containing protein n=1 Tax=uncultured Thiodictyon sp. TaxID=1846217 RepID=UPI0025EAE4A2|nr:DUF262 domain-containing protein [uncultured Thiodictyon sp.]